MGLLKAKDSENHKLIPVPVSTIILVFSSSTQHLGFKNEEWISRLTYEYDLADDKEVAWKKTASQDHDVEKGN